MDCWEIAGIVTDADQRQVSNIADRVAGSRRTALFYLNSEGGDVEASIAIGQQLRRIRATAVMWDEARCLSSCVFILVGATQRVLAGQIGIHRPYSLRTDVRSYETVQQDQRRLKKIAKQYLEEMNVSPSLYDAMVRIPPEKVKFLSPSELHQFGISEVDPVQQEVEDTGEARSYGLSKTEYLRRKAEVEVVCAREWRRGTTFGDFDGYFSCRDKVFRTAR